MATSLRRQFFPLTYTYVFVKAGHEEVMERHARRAHSRSEINGAFADVAPTLQPFRRSAADKYLYGLHDGWTVILGNRMAGIAITSVARQLSVHFATDSLGVGLSEGEKVVDSTYGRTRHFALYSDGELLREIARSSDSRAEDSGDPLCFEGGGNQRFTPKVLREYCKSVGVSLEPEDYESRWFVAEWEPSDSDREVAVYPFTS